MFLEGRPPVNVGVTNSGDVFGGTQVSFGDVLGDKQVNLFAASISQYRTLSLSYVDLSRRFQFALQGYSQRSSSTASSAGCSTIPAFAPLLSRDDAIATRTGARRQRVRHLSFQPLPPRRSCPAASIQLNEQYNDQNAAGVHRRVPAGALRHDRPAQRHADAARRRVRAGDDGLREFGSARRQHHAPGLRLRAPSRSLLSRQTTRRRSCATTCGSAGSGLLATRFRGFRSTGSTPTSSTSAATPELRGYDYLEFAGQNVVFANAELPLPAESKRRSTPIGVVGGVRGVFFAGVGGAWFTNQADPDPCLTQERRSSSSTTTRRSVRVADRPAVRARRPSRCHQDPVTGVRRRC
jgi:hypothetical protein